MIKEWRPWVSECVTFLMDENGAIVRFKFPGSYGDQPKIDIDIYTIIKSTWVKCENRRIKQDDIKRKRGLSNGR